MLAYIICFYLFFGILIASFFSTFALNKRKTAYMKLFALMSFLINLYLFGYLLEINSEHLEAMKFWNLIQYLGIPFFPVLWLIVTLMYTKKSHALNPFKVILLFLVPILSIFFRLTNSYFHLFYTEMSIKQNEMITYLYLENGLWYYVQAVYFLVILLFVCMILIYQFHKSKQLDRLRYLFLFLASVIPYAGLILNSIPTFDIGINYTALMLPISLLLVLYTVIRYDFLEIKSLARDTMFENSKEGMILLDNDYDIMDYNKTAKILFSYLGLKLENSKNLNLFNPNIEMINKIKSDETHVLKINAHYTDKYYELTSSIMTDYQGRRIGTLKSFKDITETKQLQQKLETLATTDELSGLNNRREFMKNLQLEFDRAKRYNELFYVLMMDIDHFKQINDTYGHQIGDIVISQFGKLIRDNFRKTDIFGRVGGEEFSVVLLNTTPENAYLVAEKFRKIVELHRFTSEEISLNITVSIGVASYGHSLKDVAELLKNADIALYEAKEKGKNKTTVLSMI